MKPCSVVPIPLLGRLYILNQHCRQTKKLKSNNKRLLVLSPEKGPTKLVRPRVPSLIEPRLDNPIQILF